MKPMEINQRMLTWLYICRPDENATEREKIGHKMFAVFVLSILVWGFFGTSAFVLKFWSTQLEACFFAILSVCAEGNMFYVILMMIISRQKIIAMFDSLAKLYDEHENKETFQYLEKANNQSNGYWRWYIKYVMGGYLINTTAMCALSLIGCRLGEGTWYCKDLYRPYNLVTPWNQHTLPGYFGEIAYDIGGGVTYFIGYSFILLYISVCIHYRAFYEMFEHSVKKLNQRSGERRNNKEHICSLIRFHIETKNLFVDSTETFSSVLLVQLITTMIQLSCSVFQLDMSLKHFSGIIVVIIINFSNCLSNLFFYCYFGVVATSSFEKLSYCLYEGNWINLPIGLQKYMIIMIANSQRPIYYHGFGMIYLNLETFTKLLKTVYTFYMMFRTATAND